ncbi:MAG: DUF6063 family protein [Desulfovibrio sp.]|nr:DUF6063 family protein [Desulfovibrio sp.]
MAYSLEEIEQSQAIFAYLLEHHELEQSREPELYRSFLDSEAVQVLLQHQAEYLSVDIARYDDVIYLFPAEDNYFLGFSKSELKQQLCRSNTLEADYYLALFAIMVLILKFYDGYGNSSKIRDYLRFGDWQNSIAEYLKRGMNRYDEAEQNASGLLFTAMSQSYESLRSDEKLSRRKTTKEGFLYAIIRFLQEQGLVIYIEKDEMIKTARKFDHFMDWNLLDRNNYSRVLRLMDTLEKASGDETEPLATEEVSEPEDDWEQDLAAVGTQQEGAGAMSYAAEEGGQ